MILLDTCILIFDALCPQKLSPAAKRAITAAESKNQLYCSDISLWEIAMLIEKKRVDPGTDTATFLQLIFQSRNIQVIAIDIDIATLSVSHLFKHHDPADRLIAATAMHHRATLMTCDEKLKNIPGLTTL